MTLTDILDGWKAWLPAAVIEIIGPWQESVTGLNLISGYWQPALNIFCAVVGVLSAIILSATLKGGQKSTQKRWAIGAAIAAIVFVVICLALNLSVSDVVYPEGIARVAVWLGWCIAYVTIFIASGLALSAVGLLLA